ncbi:MAG: hypothetical protein ACE145_13595 [Terriglobia bacterium]
MRSAGLVLLDGEAVQGQSVVYMGDQIKTQGDGASLSLPQGSLAVLGQNSQAVLERSHPATLIGLEAGTLTVSFANQEALHVRADGLRLSPTGTFPALAEVAMKGDGTLIVAVHRGRISIAELRAEPVVLSAGQIITVNPRVAQAQGSKPIGTGAHGKMTLGEKLRTFHIGSLSHGASVAIVGGAIAGATAASIIVPLTVGEEKSPFVP